MLRMLLKTLVKLLSFTIFTISTLFFFMDTLNMSMHRNRGNLTVGLKNETVEIVGIIFPRPLPHSPPKTYGFDNTVLLHNFYLKYGVHSPLFNKVCLR